MSKPIIIYSKALIDTVLKHSSEWSVEDTGQSEYGLEIKRLMFQGREFCQFVYEPKIEPAPRPLLADAEVGWVCRLKNGKWVTITEVDTDRMPIRTSDGLWYKLDGTADTIPMEKHIIHCEPLAPEGSAEWAMQMLKLGKRVDFEPYNNQWKLSEPQLKPEPAPFRVGDWVTDGVVTGKITSWGMGMAYVKCDDKEYHLDIDNLLKLSTSEVRVTITLSGTVTPANYESFFLKHENKTGQYTMIRFADLDPATAELVRELVAKQEEK